MGGLGWVGFDRLVGFLYTPNLFRFFHLVCEKVQEKLMKERGN